MSFSQLFLAVFLGITAANILSNVITEIFYAMRRRRVMDILEGLDEYYEEDDDQYDTERGIQTLEDLINGKLATHKRTQKD